MIRFIPFFLVSACFLLAVFYNSIAWAIFLLPLFIIGLWDLFQTSNSLYRNYPFIGHIRSLSEQIRPQIHQYFVESDTEGKPVDRVQRSQVSQRSNDKVD